MAPTRSRLVIAVLVLLVLLEGMALVVPHDHHPPSRTRLCENPSCPDPTAAHVGAPAAKHHDSCLACALVPVTMAAPGSTANVDGIGPTGVVGLPPTCLPRTFHRLGFAARGPPPLVIG